MFGKKEQNSLEDLNLSSLSVEDNVYLSQVANNIDKYGYSVVYLCSPTNPGFVDLSNAAVSAFNKIWNNDLYEGLGGRVDKASIDFTDIEQAESILVELLQSSVIPSLLRARIGNRIFYDKCFSKFRGVNPQIDKQMKYAPLHFDGEFLPGPTYNLCIPFTGYGGPFPGLEVWKHRRWHSLLKVLLGVKLYKLLANSFMRRGEPIVAPGYALIFNENVLHKRSVFKKTAPRINVEFRFFAEAELSNEDLNLTEF